MSWPLDGRASWPIDDTEREVVAQLIDVALAAQRIPGVLGLSPQERDLAVELRDRIRPSGPPRDPGRMLTSDGLGA